MANSIERIKETLKKTDGTALLAIDGMIDEIWELLEKRVGATEYTKMLKMKDYGTAITSRGTGGFAIERVLKRRSCGGFVGNTGRAVATLGFDTTFLGMFGEEEPRDPLFDEFKGLATIVGIGKPANIQVLEFSDGKIMMPYLDELINLSWDRLVSILGVEKITTLLDVDIVGLGYWSNMYDFEGILTNMVDICLKNGKTKRFFHDFANLSKRTPEALLEALKVLEREDKRIPQTLSLNEHEGALLAKAYGIDYPDNINDPASLDGALASVTAIRDKMNIDQVVIHTLYYAVIATANEGVGSARQNYCENPVKTTGAGDTFNGGYMVASLTDMTPSERMCMANATTLCFVSTGDAPTKDQVIKKLDEFKID